MSQYEVVVIGAGHAGCEAALAAARSGAATCLVTMDAQTPAVMPCNPAVGGIAKSHLVFELDALGGEIGRNADYTGIQFRVLNTRKGPAVRSNRVQCDKEKYSRRMAAVLRQAESLDVIPAEATDIIIKDNKVAGVRTADGSVINCEAAIVTPGTYLRGAIHVGDKSRPGGRNDQNSADRLAESLERIGCRMLRLKTGTPPRIRKESIDYQKMEIQEGVVPPAFFSWQAAREYRLFHVEQPLSALRPWLLSSCQIPCYITRTTEETHSVVERNLGRSSLYGGHITGTGVRYCPSFEDKVVKFPEKMSHHVFIEPEGRDTALVYPNGISNSLPEDVQADMVHSIPGLGSAVVELWGYAIEYDFCDPTQLSHTLESSLAGNLYLAGQINGTTGYEEAAAQGFVAGVNAVRKLRGLDEFVLGRDEAYIGVMVDDLVTKGTDEPYRMFTSRAEFRLLLRQDNARFRLADWAEKLGLISKEYLTETRRVEDEIRSALSQSTRRQDITNVDLSKAAREQVEFELKYGGYIERQRLDVERLRGLEEMVLPGGLDYEAIGSLKKEAREKLSRVRPATVGQASRIPGITPADVSVLVVAVRSPGGRKVPRVQ